jgi:Family of unknown function (DUF5678)
MTVAEQVQAEETLGRALVQYAGSWVAIRDHEVVCHAETLRGLLAAIETQDIGHIDRILEVSEDPAVSCFF